jgi:hypothetical protein
MPSHLPTVEKDPRRVNQFGLGPDDYSDYSIHGEDEEENDVEPKSLPGPGPNNDFPCDKNTLYNYYSSELGHDCTKCNRPIPSGDEYEAFGTLYHKKCAPKNAKNVKATSELPGDIDGIQNNPKWAEAKLPSEEENPIARADYYDRQSWGKKKKTSVPTSDIWAEHGGDVFADEQDESLPTSVRNEGGLDNFLNALGNFWSGYETEDLNQEYGFPSMDYQENSNWPKSNQDDSGGKVMSGSMRTATDIERVKELTKDVIKEYGKKGLTRRQILSYLQKIGEGFRQYLASDIIRCLKLSHDVIVKDVMDEFPVKKIASIKFSSRAKEIHESLLKFSSENISPEMFKLSTEFARVVADVEKLGM